MLKLPPKLGPLSATVPLYHVFLLPFLIAVLGPRCCTWAFSRCGKRCASHCSGCSCCRAQGPGTQASAVGALLPRMWNLLRPATEPKH